MVRPDASVLTLAIPPSSSPTKSGAPIGAQGLRHFQESIMTMSAFNRHCAAAPVFLNFRSESFSPCASPAYWGGPGDTLFSFKDREAFKR